MPAVSRNAECVLRILRGTKSLTTVGILEAARRPENADICSDCAGGDSFVVAANELVELGLITRSFGKGGYRWQLVSVSK
jgi:hypothetical protein